MPQAIEGRLDGIDMLLLESDVTSRLNSGREHEV
jgi:hypothetical protein